MTSINGNTRNINITHTMLKSESSYILRFRLSAIHKVKRAFERDDISVNVKLSEYFSRVEASNPLRRRDLNLPAFWTLKCISVTLSGSASRFVAGGLRARSGYDATRTTFRSACGIRRRRSLHCEPLVGRRSRESRDRFRIWARWHPDDSERICENNACKSRNNNKKDLMISIINCYVNISWRIMFLRDFISY